ncbi:hypothetical protein KJ966_03135 [bacterium]|nr:hypothetical protein [bacterium]
MSNNPLEQKSAVMIKKEAEKLETNRIGWIEKVDEVKGLIWVNYEKSPSQTPLLAKLANPWISIQHLKEAILRKAVAQIDFEKGNALKPIVRNLFYSVAEEKKSPQSSAENKIIHVKADEIHLIGRKKVVIQSGNARTTYIADGGELIEEAEQIDSCADLNHRIKGGAVLIN